MSIAQCERTKEDRLAIAKTLFSEMFANTKGSKIVLDAGYKRTRFASVDIDEFASKAIEANDLGFKIATFDWSKLEPRATAANGYATGEKEEICEMVAITADVDAEKPGYPTRQQVLQALHGMPCSPSFIVNSNGEIGGLHVYWLFDAPAPSTEYERIKELSERWQELLRRYLKLVCQTDNNSILDKTFSPNRPLRCPGSVRAKSGEIVSIHTRNADEHGNVLRYSIETLEQNELRLRPPEADPPKRAYKERISSDEDKPISIYLQQHRIDIASILEGQGWKKLSEKKWIHGKSQSGAHSAIEHTQTDGTPGLTVYSGACGLEQGWHTTEAIWVAFHHSGDWREAARFCHAELELEREARGGKVDLSMVTGNSKQIQDKQPKSEQAIVTPKKDGEVAIHTKQQTNSMAAAGDVGKKTINIKARIMSEVSPEQIEWWWPNKIPSANLIIFAGQGGCGKSSVCVDLIARHTTGQPFPNDTEYREPGNVAIINCEDDAATIQRPRLDAAGADCSRIHLLDSLEFGGDELWIDFSLYYAQIEQYIIDNHCSLLVVDPISGHIGGKKQNDTAEVRAVLQKLQAMAKRTRCTVIAITHSPKTANSAQGSVIGSQAFVSCARAAFAFVVDKDDPKRRLMLNAKSNYSPDETGLAYRIENCGGVGRVEWEADPITDHPDSFFAEHSSKESRQRNTTEVEHAASCLAQFLTEPKSRKEINEWAKAQMIADSTLRRAKTKNGHEAEKRADGWYWLPAPGADIWQP